MPRVYVVIYDSSTGYARIAYRDPDDPYNSYYVDTEIPPFHSVSRARDVAAALNAAAAKI